MYKPLLSLFLLPLVLLVLFDAAPLEAGVSGKISGEVIDSRTGEPIVGATVRLAGTNIATQTDVDGEYFMIDMPVGKCDLSVTFMGYKSITKQGVRVLVDLTTPVDFELNQQAVEIGQEIIVVATNPIVQLDQTESRVIFTADRLKDLPNITTVQSVLTNYPGVVVGRDDRLHVRGGRAGQVAYYYDGFSVQDPFYSTAGIRIMPSALEELSLTSGGYTAEYGEALSGVVNAVTRDGGPIFHGGIKVYEGVTHPYDVNTGDWGDLKRVGNRSVAFNLSGPILGMDPKRYTFFTAGEYLTDETSLPANGYDAYTWTAKVTAQPTPRVKLKSHFTYYDASGGVYTHRDVNGISYDFNLDGLPVFEKKSHLLGLTGNYNFNESMIFSATVNTFRTRTWQGPPDLIDTYWDQWPGYTVDSATGDYNGTIDDDNYLGYRDYENPYHVVGFTLGDDFNPTFRRRESKYTSVKASLLTQVNKSNQVKAGIEYRRYDVAWDSKQFFNDNPYGEKYSSKPLMASAFLQDKLEYKNFVINVGLRFDYHNADINYNVTPREAPLDTVARYVEAKSKSRLSPRLGVSFPISETSVMHFNYGVYYQEPRFTYLYTNIQGDVTSGLPLLGNPDLEPEQTISYELGLDHLIGEDLRIDLTAYYKDIEDLATTRASLRDAATTITYFDNGDYGSVTGFDVQLQKLSIGGYLGGSISYGYMVATGNGSYATEPYYTFLTSAEDTLAPVGEYPLDFDQRHTVTAVLSYRVPADWDGELFGLSLPGAWGFTTVGHYGSGLPYTPTDPFGHRLGERNEGRLPASYAVDMRFSKEFSIGRSGYTLGLFTEVDNLFDRRNVLDVYSRTGQPDNDGQQIGLGLAADEEELNQLLNLDRLHDQDPQNYSPPRTLRVGLEFTF